MADELKRELRQSKITMANAIMAIFGSLLAFMFYGRIQDASDIIRLREQVDQLQTEQLDLWNKYNKHTESQMKFMIQDAREKEKIKEIVKDIQLQETERWLKFYEKKSN